MTRAAVSALLCALVGGLGFAAAPPAEDPPPPAADAESRPAAPPAEAAAASPPEDLAAQIEALKRLIEEQKALIEAQQKKLDEQEKALATEHDDLDARTKEIAELRLMIEAMTRRLDELQQELPSSEAQKAIEERLKRVEETASKVPELPPDVITAGDFPGSIRIPGTDAAVKFGGRVRVAVVTTIDPLGSRDRFLTNSIPVDPAPSPDSGKQTNINANTSRFNFELRTPTGAGQMRAFIEGDFFGTGNTFRLRHAFGQFHGFLFGQTWSTFSDPAANHDDLDFEGVSSENVVRQPQIRHTWTLPRNQTVAAAIETPRVDVTNGVGSDVYPDLIGRYIWKFGGSKQQEEGHLQIAGVARQIRATSSAFPDDFVTEYGWGIGISGVVPFYYFNLTDRFIFQLNGGAGIGRYINDLNSLGGQDGVFDPVTGDFEVLSAFGWFLDYEHMWKRWHRTRDMNLRSSVIWSVVTVDNASFQTDDSYHRTQRLVGNLIWSPIKRMDVGVEYLWGARRNKDGERGEARQVQFVIIGRF